MIKLENYEVLGWDHAIRGMRNPMNSWDKSDSGKCEDLHGPLAGHVSCDCDDPAGCPTTDCERFVVGPNDQKLMMTLANAGPVHGKFRRMITVYVDITAPLYWWKEFDTYKVGTVANSCSTMHKIHDKEFTLGDFSCEHLNNEEFGVNGLRTTTAKDVLGIVIDTLNFYRRCFIEDSKSKDDWWQMIQLLPSSYNQKRTVQLNYEVLANIYQYRKDHKLDEWRELCKWIEGLPYSEIITGASQNVDEGNGTGGKDE